MVAMLHEFQSMDADAVRVEGHGWKDAHSGQSTIQQAIRQQKINGIKVHVRGGDLFLVKEL